MAPVAPPVLWAQRSSDDEPEKVSERFTRMHGGCFSTSTLHCALHLAHSLTHSSPRTRQNIVLLTIDVPNLPAPPATRIDLKAQSISFEAKVGDKAKGIEEKEFKLDLDLFAEIDPEVSSHSVLCLHRIAYTLAFSLHKAPSTCLFSPQHEC